MVFRCQTCKSRHVKCDAVQPICSRCKKAGRTCTWDPNDHVAETGLHFRIENAFAQGQPRRPRKVRETIPEPAAATTLSTPDIPDIPAKSSHALDVQAFHYWLENFMFRLEDLPDIGHEYGAYVIFHWVLARPGSSLHLALFALSHAVFGRANHVDKALEDADRAHAQSIVKMQEEMEEIGESPNGKIDQLLVTTMLMSSYQNVMHGNQRQSTSFEVDEVGSRLWKSLCHHEGALALLKLRREQGPPPYLPIHRVVRRQVIRTSILRGVSVPEWLQDGGEYGEEGPALEIDAFMVRVASLRTKSLTLLSGSDSNPPSDTRHSEDIALETHELDTALAAWSQTIPEDWMFSTSPPRPDYPETDFFYNGLAHEYATHGHAAIWNRYRTIRIIVNSIRIRSLAKQLQTLEYPSQRSFVAIQQDSCRENILSLTNDLCGGIPFFFNILDPTGNAATPRSIGLGKYTFRTEDEIFPKMAGLIAWPLTVAVSTEYVPESQRQWLKARLKAVAKSLGDAVLESVVEQGEFRF